MSTKITEKQANYLLSLVNKVEGTKFRFLSQVTIDGIGKRVSRVQGMSSADASALIAEYAAAATKPVAAGIDENDNDIL